MAPVVLLEAALVSSGGQESVDVKVMVGAGRGTVLEVVLQAHPAMGLVLGVGVGVGVAGGPPVHINHVSVWSLPLLQNLLIISRKQ